MCLPRKCYDNTNSLHLHSIAALSCKLTLNLEYSNALARTYTLKHRGACRLCWTWTWTFFKICKHTSSFTIAHASCQIKDRYCLGKRNNVERKRERGFTHPQEQHIVESIVHCSELCGLQFLVPVQIAIWNLFQIRKWHPGMTCGIGHHYIQKKFIPKTVS